MAERLQLRVPQGSKERWQEASDREGVTLSELVRRSVENYLSGRSVKSFARAVAAEVLPEIERMVAGEQRAEAQGLLQVEMQKPKQWDRACFDADLHAQGRVCGACGGSY